MKNKLLATIALVGILCMSASADFVPFGAATGYMNVFEINGTGDGAGAYQFGSGWGVPDVKTLTSDDLTFELFPNINTYDDNPGDAYWRNNAGAGPDGNKWLEASTFRELTLGAGETGATLDFNVSLFDLDPRYELTVFVKTLNPPGYGVSAIDSQVISGTIGTTTLSIGGPGSELVAGDILQIGFQMAGINASGLTDWGSATATLESVDVVPEPATMGLLALSGGFMMLIRRFRRHYRIG